MVTTAARDPGTMSTTATTLRMNAMNISELERPALAVNQHDAFGRLLKRCEGFAPVTCAIVHPCDRDSLVGAIEAAQRKLLVPLLVGPEAKIRAVAAAEKI